jgi:hypothetical protein
VLVVDACRSGSLIGLKGAQPTQPFSVTALDEPAPEGFAVLASSTATENAQESVSLGGSFFTYYLNSGLLGAADQNRDGAVTLSELYAFASSETRAATVSSPAGQQTPTFQFMLGGRHDLVLTRPGRHDARMGVLEFAEAGRYVVQPWDAGVLAAPVAELAAHEPGARLALPPGHYHITRRGERDIAERDTDVAGGETTVLAAASMTRVGLGRVVRKGDVRRSATGFAMAAGWRTDELGSSTLAFHGLGTDVAGDAPSRPTAIFPGGTRGVGAGGGEQSIHPDREPGPVSDSSRAVSDRLALGHAVAWDRGRLDSGPTELLHDRKRTER